MTPDDLLARLEADLRVQHALDQAERPEGLTASRVLGCSSAAARILLDEPKGSEGDAYRGLRGTWMHAGLNDTLALDPGFTDGREAGRFTWHSPLGPVTGEFDLALDGVLCEIKTRPKAECRFRADHGAEPQHAAQAAVAATALGLTEAYVIYLPTDAGWHETACCPVDVRYWTREAEAWCERVDVRGEVDDLVESGVPRPEAVRRVLDGVPREPQPAWCREFCPFVKACRDDYVAPADMEITDPTLRLAAEEAEHWRSVRLDAEKREKAAKHMLAHTEGVLREGASMIRVAQEVVKPTPERRGHRKTKIDRRPV